MNNTNFGSVNAPRNMDVETGGCPHTAIREDASMNLAPIEGTRGTDDSCGRTHDRGRFAIPGATAVGTRSPISCIFQYTGHGPIVFRRNKRHLPAKP